MSCAEFLVKHQITQVTQPHSSPDLAPWDFWLFPKLNPPLKGKRFQTIDQIQENTMGKLMATGKTVWGPKVPALKGTEVLLSYEPCLMFLASSLINVSIFHNTWLYTFRTDLVRYLQDLQFWANLILCSHSYFICFSWTTQLFAHLSHHDTFTLPTSTAFLPLLFYMFQFVVLFPDCSFRCRLGQKLHVI